MHNLDLYRLLFDLGFMVLIWIVQLIIYPGFRYMPSKDLVVWHRIYSNRITIILAPLFLGQLVISLVQLWQSQNYYTISSVVLVLLLWLITMVLFMPLHRRISINSFDVHLLQKLERLNWVRTALWTILFVSSFIYHQRYS